MKYFQITIILFTFCVSNLVAQQNDFIEYIKVPDSLVSIGELEAGISEYNKLLKTSPIEMQREIAYPLAQAYALSKNLDSALIRLEFAIQNDTTIGPFSDPYFYNLQETKPWDSLRDVMISRVEAKYSPYDNIEFSKELWSMGLNDQAFYYHIDLAEATVGRDSPVYSALWELKKQLNKDNVKRLEELIEEFGWPTFSVAGGSAANSAFLIVQHADIEVQKKYLLIMKEAANNKEASWGSLALLIDRVNLREGKPQVYGSQIYRNDDGTFYVKDLENPEYVNLRRKEVGLGPIEQYVGYWDIEWTIEQKEE